MEDERRCHVRHGRDETHLGDISILESSLSSDGVPINVGLVAGVLDDAEEQHGLGGSGLFLVVSHGSDLLDSVSLRTWKRKYRVSLHLSQEVKVGMYFCCGYWGDERREESVWCGGDEKMHHEQGGLGLNLGEETNRNYRRIFRSKVTVKSVFDRRGYSRSRAIH